ncbi:MAG: nucleotidyltransferase domain-containing protein [Endomicrobiales bacterium]|jgi:predicted nucleotidyltransferase
MNEKDYKNAAELKEKIAGIASLVDFRVYGSRARGDFDQYSDLDVFVEVEHLDRDLKKKINHLSWGIGFNNYMLISSLIFTRHEIENSPLRSSPIVKNIFTEGVRI